MSTLRASVTAGDAGPVLVLAGEADVTNAEQLRNLIGAQLASGAVYLRIDAAGLSFADSRAIGILAGTGRTLKELGGGLVLLLPQKRVLRTLTLLGVDQVITIHAAADMAHKPNGDGTTHELVQAAQRRPPERFPYGPMLVRQGRGVPPPGRRRTGPGMTAPPERVLARACRDRCAGRLTAKGATWLQPDGIP